MSTPKFAPGEREALDRLLYAREALAPRLQQLLEQANARKWQLADEDWDLLEAITVKLESITALIDEAQRAVGIKPPWAPGAR